MRNITIRDLVGVVIFVWAWFCVVYDVYNDLSAYIDICAVIGRGREGGATWIEIILMSLYEKNKEIKVFVC